MASPSLLSDKDPCYVSKALKEHSQAKDIRHSPGKPYHPMTQGKIECYHRSMKNLLLLEPCHSPLELKIESGGLLVTKITIGTIKH
jgi:transposase InsO family protein